MRLSQILFSQGFGSRRECHVMLRNERVSVQGHKVDDPDADFEPEGLQINVSGVPWVCHTQAVVLLNKPAGYECSRKPRHHPSVLSLLPLPLRNRGVQPIGRLDEDTTGVLLLTDQGALIHRLTHPKHHVPKVYDVTTKHPVDDAQVAALLAGVVLVDDPTPAIAATAERLDSTTLRMTLTDGRYHQVKRMMAAVGNRCEALHRSAFGSVRVPPDLAPGQWCWLEDDVVAALAGR